MSTEEKLSGAVQENVLTLLTFSDEFCKVIRFSITPNLFESAVFRDIATHAIDFIDQFGEAIKDHLPDSLEHILAGTDKRKATSYTRVLDNLYQAKDHVNGEYVVSTLHEFIRLQNIKSAVIKAAEAIDSGDLEKAEVEMQKGLNSQCNTFEVGTFLADPLKSLAFFDSAEAGIQTGIRELDVRDICPRPQELFLWIAPAKRGKTWALIHCGKTALLQRKRVLHITLEMSEARVSQRYIQQMFSISKRKAEIKMPVFNLDKIGRLIDIEMEKITRPSLQDEGIKEVIKKRLEELKRKPPLVIKQFPTGSLTISGLKAYLNGLERFHKFIPDMLILDYPKIMKTDSDNLRLDLGRIMEELRGIAVERNIAVVTAAQGNRNSSKAKLVTDDLVGEDYSQIQTADNVVTYSQTPQEKLLGLARLFVSNGRNDEDKFTVLISQAYQIGQFCLDSTRILSNYFDLIDRKNKSISDEEDDD